jgi:hypothetical protein
VTTVTRQELIAVLPDIDGEKFLLTSTEGRTTEPPALAAKMTEIEEDERDFDEGLNSSCRFALRVCR